jgi:hypothetical protein
MIIQKSKNCDLGGLFEPMTGEIGVARTKALKLFTMPHNSSKSPTATCVTSPKLQIKRNRTKVSAGAITIQPQESRCT